MDKLKKEFGARIKKIRTSKKLSQAKLSEKIGMTADNLSRIELGKTFPNIENINKIAKALDITPGHLFQDTNLSAPKFEEIPSDAMLTKEINKLIKTANLNTKRLIYRLIKEITSKNSQ